MDKKNIDDNVETPTVEYGTTWYADGDLIIKFSEIPRVCMRYIVPSTTKAEAKSIKKYPFMNKKTIQVYIRDRISGKEYKFTIAKGYCFDGCTIPRLFWRLIGSPTDNTFILSSMVHDELCLHHDYIDNNRNLSSRVFKALLIAGDVNKFKAQIMYLAVDNFQRFCHW